MKDPNTKKEQGPRVGWGSWRTKADRRIEKPRRNKAAQKLTAAGAKVEPDATDSASEGRT